MRDALFADMAKWGRQVPRSDIDILRCYFRWTPYQRVKAVHDAYRQFVEGDVIPRDKFPAAKQYADKVGMQFDNVLPALPELSRADIDACCRAAARGVGVSGRPDCPGDR